MAVLFVLLPQNEKFFNNIWRKYIFNFSYIPQDTEWTTKNPNTVIPIFLVY